MMGQDYVFITADINNYLRVNYACETRIRYLLSSAPSEKLVYYEIYDNSDEAVERTGIINGWSHRKKEIIINLFNPRWKDCKHEILNIEETL